MTERIETVTQITNDQLKAGGFAFQLPETATGEERDAFSKLVHTTKEKGLNLILDSSVKVIDLNAPVPAPVVPAAPVTAPVVTEATPASTTVEVPAAAPAVPATPVAPETPPIINGVYQQQPMYFMPPMGMQSWGQPVPQPVMQQPQPMMVPYMFPYSGIQIPQPVQVAPTTTEKK